MTNIPAWAELNLPRHLALLAGLAIFSSIVVRVMIAIGVPDHPDPRKSHNHVTPKSGGVGIVAAFLLGVLLLYRYGSVSRLSEHYFLGVIAAAVLMAVVSFIDDVLDLPVLAKLGAQLAAASAAVGSGVWVHVFLLPYFRAVDIGWLGIPVTFIFILFITNAMNFIDGLNGLAAGVTLICPACNSGRNRRAFMVVSLSTQPLYCWLAGCSASCRSIFPNAKIFMGDVGSQFCGFMLALFGIAAARYEAASLSFLLIPLLLSGVLFDVTFTLIRRALAGENLARAHRSHLYQIAQRSGLNAEIVALLHWGFVVIGGLTAAGFLLCPKQWKLPIVLAPFVIQLIWAAYVIRRARKSGIEKW